MTAVLLLDYDCILVMQGVNNHILMYHRNHIHYLMMIQNKDSFVFLYFARSMSHENMISIFMYLPFRRGLLRLEASDLALEEIL